MYMYSTCTCDTKKVKFVSRRINFLNLSKSKLLVTQKSEWLLN